MGVDFPSEFVATTETRSHLPSKRHRLSWRPRRRVPDLGSDNGLATLEEASVHVQSDGKAIRLIAPHEARKNRRICRQGSPTVDPKCLFRAGHEENQ